MEDFVNLEIQSRGANDQLNATMFRISERKRERCGDMFIPNLFCIGPYHREMEKLFVKSLKIKFVIDFLDRQGEHEDRRRIFNMYWNKINELGQNARSFYLENLAIDQNNFTKMLLLDGIFIIEVLLKHVDQTLLKDRHLRVNIRNLKRDLILLENQIPFFVLRELHKVFDNSCVANLVNSGSQISLPKLDHLAMIFFDLRMPPPNAETNDQIEYLLDLFHRGFVPVSRSVFVSVKQLHDNRRRTSRSVQSATVLKEFGVNFEKDPNADFLEVNFEEGTLKIFLLDLDERKMCVYANLVALEEVNVINGKPVTSLCYLLKSLIRNAEDLSLLVRHNVIENTYSNDGDIINLFNNICLDTSLEPDNHHLSVVFKKIQLYCDKKWHKWWTVFKRDYLRWPWSVVSTFLWPLTVAAFLILQFYWKEEQWKRSDHSSPMGKP